LPAIFFSQYGASFCHHWSNRRAVPEVPVDEHDHLRAREHEVRTSGQAVHVNAETQAVRVEQAPDDAGESESSAPH
jgi:hypothetical protein